MQMQSLKNQPILFRELMQAGGSYRERTVADSLSLPHARYKTHKQTAPYDRLVSSLNALPGFVSAGAGSDCNEPP